MIGGAALQAPADGPQAASDITLGMMHLSPGGISEQWLLRACGDRHWSMIAGALGQERAAFTDAEGRSIYAAFCATDLWLAPPADHMCQRATLVSALYDVSGALLGSEHELFVHGQMIARLRMVSSFVGRDETGANRRIVRRMPGGQLHLPAATRALRSLADDARVVARRMRTARPRGTPAMTATPCPALDFNAVGLLYFPAFSAFAERLEWTRGQPGALRGRRVVYAGNLDAGDRVDLFTRTPAEIDLVRSDGRVIGHVTVRRDLRSNEAAADPWDQRAQPARTGPALVG